MDGIELVFEDGAFREIAHQAIEREIGARGLRSIIEGIMMKPMFELPSRTDVKRAIITAEFVRGEAELKLELKNIPEIAAANE
jgi:ATP-dependent Clp protease ATP-binding subunit ClpX